MSTEKEKNSPEKIILFALAEHKQLTWTELLEKTQLTRTTLAATINKLKHDSFVKVGSDLADRRRAVLTITRAGRATVEVMKLNEELKMDKNEDAHDMAVARFAVRIVKILQRDK